MSHTIRDKQKLKARASKIQGQVAALKTMLDEPHECAQAPTQLVCATHAPMAAFKPPSLGAQEPQQASLPATGVIKKALSPLGVALSQNLTRAW